MATAVLQCSRSQLDTFLRGEELCNKFHDLFRIRDDSPNKKKGDKKKNKKKGKSKAKERNKKREGSPDIPDAQFLSVELQGNASGFNVYASVRQSVLEQCMRDTARLYRLATTTQTSDSETDDDNDDKNKDCAIKIPKIVGLGLNGVFELVRETRHKYPDLCVKALKALLDLLQGQQPEGMKCEPPDVVENLYNLLMEIATNVGSDIVFDGQSLTALACSALISLTIALGDTGKLLKAVKALLMSPSSLASQDILVPGILTSLQKSVQAVLLGKAQLPDWFNNGVKTKSHSHKFNIANLKNSESTVENSAVASDGRYLYILNKKGLFKIGTGYGGTIKGNVYKHRENFPVNRTVWLAFSGGKLLCRSDNNSSPGLCVINRDSLDVKAPCDLDGHTIGQSVLFSDGESIGQIAPAKDCLQQDSFVVRTFSPDKSPMSVMSEIPLKLTRKCMDVFGSNSLDPEMERRSIHTGFDEDIASVSTGKEFTLIRTVGGKLLYSGKSAALGIKQGGPSQGKWAELPITKSPKIVHLAVGHDGQHALMVSEDGGVFFVGTPRRGEDGDSSLSKNRRQPKPVKPKKMIRLESRSVVYAACNSGSSAVVTKEGEVYMYGKDTAHCDHASGHVTDLKDVVVTQIGLGKAHAVALTNKGQIFTYGINNKGQCGRDFNPGASRETSSNVMMAEEEEEVENDDALCGPGKHRWKQDQCMVCTVCGECTGYGVSCINSNRVDRNPGMPCGCGAGDSGCAECGACRVCAGEKLELEELDERGLLEVFAKDGPVRVSASRQGVRHVEQLGKRLEQKMELRKAQQKLVKEKRQREGGSDPEAENIKLVSLPPLEVQIGAGDVQVTQITCGQHHTVVLLQNGDVYTFGSNHQGQLGLGDTGVRGSPSKVPLPLSAVQVAAGSYHTVILLTSGQVYTFGNYQKGALGRMGPDEGGVKSKKGPWYSMPGPVPGVGSRFGRRATWIGASGDQTFMRVDESLINAHTLARSNLFASQTCIGLIPKGEDSTAIMKCLMISKVDGSCKSFSGSEQVDLSDQAVCLDPVYDLLWGYCPKTQEVNCYNVLVTESHDLQSVDPGYCDLFSPELAVPTRMGCHATRSHAALHMLGSLDTLTTAHLLNMTVIEEAREKQSTSKIYTREDYSIINRFESHGGGWGYSGHSVEAVRFMCDTDILLGGFGLFGGRGEYFGRIKIFELGVDGGENETDGEMVAETEEVPFECAAREKFAMLFDEPVHLQANNWYVAWARISGPSSDCGSSGQPSVTTDDQVVFKFKSSKKSNNGTDVNAGQIPQLLYRLPSRDSPSVIRRTELVEPAHVLSQDFAHSVTPLCFESLLRLLEWGWTTFHTAISEIDGLKGPNYEAAASDLQRLVYICRACLRLIRIYVNEVYPDGVTKKKYPLETSSMAERIGDTRDLLRRILAEEVHMVKFSVYLREPPSVSAFQNLKEEILYECHQTFRTCFHAFYPTGTLKWWCLCDLLCQAEPILEKKQKHEQQLNLASRKSYKRNMSGLSMTGTSNVCGVGRLLAAVMEAMCHPAIKLTNIMPINCEPEAEEILRRQSLCMDDNTNSAARLGEMHKYPLLASHMSYRMEIDSITGGSHISFKEVLDRLLLIVALPVRQALSKEKSVFPSSLVANTCALLVTIISELAASSTGLEVGIDLSTTSRPMLVTPNRFTRTSQSAYWNAGNGSPDAVAFTVDRPGIVVAGVCVYGGGGHYEYEVELLDEQGEGQEDVSHTQRWNSLEIVRGAYSPEDCVNDIAEIKFDRPVPIKEGVKYAVKLRNHGPRTLNGDGGMSKVKCSDGTTFTFTACSLSSNGTNHMRGQIPQILYYSAPQDGEHYHQTTKNLAELQARKNAIDITGAICRMTTDLLHRSHSMHAEEVCDVIGKSHLFSSLLPLSLAYVGPVAAQDPRGAVQVLYLIQEILPAVVTLTKNLVPLPLSNSAVFDSSVVDNSQSTTSQHYAVVESEHPYKPATVANYKVEFPPCVRWIVLEFDPQSATAQVEDSLQLYVQGRGQGETTLAKVTGVTTCDDQDIKLTHWPVLKRFYGHNNWPKQAVILPGNEVVFSLETASDYVKDEKASFYGFKCTVIGYELASKPEESVQQLERELSYLGGMCATALMRRDVALPPVTMEELDEEMDMIEEGAQLVFNSHSSLLGKGFALSHPPTIMQALEGNLPFCWQSNERAFLKDFVSCTPGTSGGRLARWLQPDSYLDPKQCEIVCNKEELKCSWPVVVTVLTKDQYGQLVNVQDLRIEVKAVPVDQKDTTGDDMKKMRRLSRPDEGDLTFGGLPPPSLDTPYESTFKDRKDIFHSITIMKAYENYSFEELRFAAPAVPRPSENMLVRANNDGTFSANWTPGCVGFYNIHATIDGFEAGDVYKVEVKEPPQGVPPPSQHAKKAHQPSRMRKFVGKCSAGLRVRVHPTLQSEQIGVVKPGGVISFIDEIHNDDGVWVRLSPDSIKEWCISGYTEAWCLQYNQHLGKALLVPVEEPKSILDEMVKEAIQRKLPEYVRDILPRPRRGQENTSYWPGVYQVVKCGSFGHNIRSRPNLKATPIGMLTLGKRLTAIEDATNVDGTWVKLDVESVDQYCHSSETEAWSLAAGKDSIVFLRHESEVGPVGKDPFSFNTLPVTSSRGFDFSGAHCHSTSLPSFSLKSDFTLGFAPRSTTTSFAFGHQEAAASVPMFGQSSAGATASPFEPVTLVVDTAGDDAQSSSGGPFTSTPMTTRRMPQPVKAYSVPDRRAPQTAYLERQAADLGMIGKGRDGRDLPPELMGVSVRELVKALGESRANGNGPTPNPSPPGSPKKTSRSSSPKPASDSGSPRSASPALRDRDSPRPGDSPRGTLQKEEAFKTPPGSPIPIRSTRGKLQKDHSFDKNVSPPVTPPPVRKELPQVPPAPEGRGKVAPVKDVPGLPTVPPPGASGCGSPRYASPVRGGSPHRRVATGSPQLGASAAGIVRPGSPGQTAPQMTGAFNIGSSSPKDEAIRLSPKANRKDRGRQLRTKRERASSPSPRDINPLMRSRSSSASTILDRPRDPVKEALSPSVAECLRAVFAAFMWHEGIVHDAMACASFLKFHPDLPKEMSKFVKEKKQEKIRVRHATDSSKDLSKEKKKDNINESRVRFNLEPLIKDISETELLKGERAPTPLRPPIARVKSEGDKWKLEAKERDEVRDKEDKELPPTIQHLVYFWEELSTSVLKVIGQDLILPSPAQAVKMKKAEKKDKEKDKEKKSKKRKEAKAVAKGNLFGDAVAGMFGGGGGERETLCELCGGSFPHPVTYHMRQNHPGCGRHACGKGYNSGGNFCGGWAGNCGEGGIGGSSWYLMCDKCRDKYLRDKKQSQKEKDKSKKVKRKSMLSKQATLVSPQEGHIVLKNNAMFLLDLASASGFTLPKHHKKPHSRADMILPSVSEDLGSELEPFPPVPFQYLVQQNAQNADSAFAEDILIDDEERVFVRSGSLSMANRRTISYRPRLPTEPRHSPLARSGSLGQDVRPFSQYSPPGPVDPSMNVSGEAKAVVKSAGTSPDNEQEHFKKIFHRSISEISSDDENSQQGAQNRAMARRRNNSGGVGDGGMSLLKHPSAAMTKLINSVDRSGAPSGNGERALQRPVMEFIIQRHDLDSLQLAMRQALRKASCRVFAMQAFNWLLRSVVQQVCLHDLFWFFTVSLMPPVDEEEEEEEPAKEKKDVKKDQEDVPLCEHPLSDITIAGKAVAPLPETFHTLLQTISDVMMQLPLGSSLQRMGVCCYCLEFTQSDHQFLHESHVFSNISRILSKSDEESEEISIDASQLGFKVSCLRDLTASAEIKASSRQAMIASLTDNSTETFWESGDEDRNKLKLINITCSNKSDPRMVYAHIDNTRDIGNKVSVVNFSAGTCPEDMKKVRQVELEPRHVGWVSCALQETQCRHLQVELKGSDQSLRVRQVKVLGSQEDEDVYLPVKKTALDLQEYNCEAETLRVFRILTSQVFGRLIFTEKENDDDMEGKKDVSDALDVDNDLKEHMVGILFSRSKLSHLQKQVCSHIVQGIRKEAARIREEWEGSLTHVTREVLDIDRSSDVYCFELLSMVLALSGSNVGRIYLAQQYGLIQDLFGLLHTATPRIQRQVTSVMRRVLPEVKPQILAKILSIPALPPVDYSIVSVATREEGDANFNPDTPGILDVFLACISKALDVQTKVKSSGPHKGVTTRTLSESLHDQPSIEPHGPRWWMRGLISSALAGTIISLIQDMAAGKLSETWAAVTKAAIAEAILNLTKLDEPHRAPETCVKTPTLWLAVSSLCVLDPDHVDRLSSGEWVASPDGQHGQPRPTCDNHDDGVTPAIILCSECGNLCADCDRYLHLHHRTRTHQRQVFKEEEEAIKVDLHEGCGRTKLFWVMALADSKTLKAMVEFREGKVSNTATVGPGTCRFCGTTSNTGMLAIGNVCSDPDCQEHARNACTQVLSCGHPCCGIKNEEPCLPCLRGCQSANQPPLKQDSDDMCMICFTEALSASPAILLKCGHVFHMHCGKKILEKRWIGPRITFGFSLCPICKNNIEHPVLKGLLDPIRELFEDVRRKALMRLEYEGLHKAEVITTRGARFFGDPAGFAMDRYAYYVCFKCKKAYYGGEARCDEQAGGGGDDYDPRELVCGGCSDVSRAQMCPKHGTDFLEYKCRYCCSVAVFFCFGTTHFCNACHDDFQRVTNIPKTDLPNCPAGPRGKQIEGDECPLHVQHPPTGEEFALGCGVCRNAHTF
ncbi:E3 ubiquitin-protein ligase MYCBP2-like isoform X7 [Haliotis rufescens]|uniref:E3 ubiquitin-protein ligase MYCBP2-like isoform X7 n=1 Tax=Haliotis rufescens TaxID=6454 RepID=UPI00201F04C2|nr:E3 ubiquitin-protein ligase MYCBP2-like isoform X7 [Haliotis rufescens]